MDSKTQRVGPGIRPNQRGLIERAQPQTRSAQQHTHGETEADLDIAEVHRREADHRPGRDAGRNDEHVRYVGCAVRDTNHFDGTRDVRGRTDDRQHVTALHFCRRQNRERLAAAGDALEKHTARRFLPAEVHQRASVDGGVRDHHIDGVSRHVQQLLVVDLA